MPIFLDTSGKSNLGVGLCGRCGIKMSLTELRPDSNSPGVLVCDADWDPIDPYRLPPREADDMTLPFYRPDIPLYPGPTTVVIPPNGETGTIQVNVPWTANTSYIAGAAVTPVNPVGFATAGQTIYQFLCLMKGTSGSSAPNWTMEPGTTVVDGSVIWINNGLYIE